MRIQFLGTGASEGFPGLYCNCQLCQKCRELGGKNLRSRQQTLIDEGMLIDFPADTLMHSYNYNLNFSKIHTCLVTHSHEDHLAPSEFFNRGGVGLNTIEKALTFYGSDKSTAVLKSQEKRLEKIGIFSVLIEEPFKPFEVRGYKVTPLKADHANAYCGPFLYLVEKDGKTYLHGTDTAYFPEETFDYLKENGIHLDAVSLDCTFFTWDHLSKTGVDGCSYGHMSLFCCSQVKERLEEIGAIDETSKVVLIHMAHGAGMLHDEMQARADQYGMIVGYDGMVLEI